MPEGYATRIPDLLRGLIAGQGPIFARPTRRGRPIPGMPARPVGLDGVVIWQAAGPVWVDGIVLSIGRRGFPRSFPPAYADFAQDFGIDTGLRFE
jgi:hypothetical protein